MIAILFSWVIIFFTLFSFGNIFIRFYNKICKEKESYNIPDTFILGICLMSVILLLTSLWFPSNQYVLLGCIVVSVVYWMRNRRMLKAYFDRVGNILNSLSLLQKSLIGVAVSSVFLYMLFVAIFFDAGFYHYQQIRWNEEYSVIPGLANFEDRYGFNSNYLLISSIFTFRFIFGEAVYMLQSTLFVLILCWAMVNLFRSGYDFRYLLILMLLVFTLLWGGYMLADTSTDIIPLLCLFYYLAKTAIKPDWLVKQPLMVFLLPITLVTFKVSLALFCLISLGVLIRLIRQKKVQTLVFLLSVAVLTVGLWCVRNVIISGYLVYPMYGIDLFGFDWKVPEGTAALQKMHIYNWATYIFDVQYVYRVFKEGFAANWIDLFGSALTLALFALVVVSPVAVLYNILKKKNIDRRIYYIYFVLLICIVFNMLLAPDFRFMNGYIFGCTLLLSTIIVPSGKLIPKTGKWATAVVVFAFLLFVGWRDRITITNYKLKPDMERILSFMLRPQHPAYDLSIKEYRMGNFSIYLKVGDELRSFGMIPVANEKGIPIERFDGDKIQDIRTIEARGNEIQDGFRTKSEYIDIINNNTEYYTKEYHKVHKTKYPSGYFEDNM